MLIIGIAGGSGSGKTTVVNSLIQKFPENNISVISQDAYYKNNAHLTDSEKKKINFDHPSSIEFPLLIQHIDFLKNGNSIQMPIYSYITCTRSKETIYVESTSILIIEGILILTDAELRKRMDLIIFIDTDTDERQKRIIERDTRERGRSIRAANKHFNDFVNPMHEQFIEPTKKYADILIPKGWKNHMAIDLLVSKLKLKISE